MANDQNRVSSAGLTIEIADDFTPARVSSVAMLLEVVDNTPAQMRVSTIGLMVEFTQALPPLITASGQGPALQVLN